MFLKLLVTAVTLADNWMIAKKMGHEGWEGIIPFYNLYLQFEDLYGNGWKFLTLLIPFYNIYVIIKYCLDLAVSFNKSKGYGVGILLLGIVFSTLLAFGDAVYGDGSKANTEADFLSKAADAVTDKLNNGGKDPQALEKLAKLDEMHNQGIISDEEFNAKKAELLEKI